MDKFIIQNLNIIVMNKFLFLKHKKKKNCNLFNGTYKIFILIFKKNNIFHH